MKKLFITTLFLFLFNNVFSQVYKWRASDFSSRQNLVSGSWTDWTPWSTSGVLIVASNERVNVYSSTPQVYDMIETVTKNYDDKSNPIYSVMCVDENGTRCKMIWYHTSDSGSYVIFQFSNLELMYKVVQLEN